MPDLIFYKTKTNLPREKVRKVLGGYSVIENCPEHTSRNTALNPRLHLFSEIIIDSKQYKCALLRPDGFISGLDSSLANFPQHTIFFYKNFCQGFDAIRNCFNTIAGGATLRFECGCWICKYTKDDLEKICSEPWYPWIGDREPAIYYNEMWFVKRKTETLQQVLEILAEVGIVDSKRIAEAIKIIQEHRRS